MIHLPDLEQFRAWLDADPTFELYLLVDSTAGLSLAGTVMRGAADPPRVLVDVGTPGGRTGVRDAPAALGLARECEHAPGIALAGVAGYEGVRPNRRDADIVAQVDAHCRETVDAFRAVSPWIQTERPVFSMGGSAFPDRVIEAIADLPDRGGRVIPVLRSGCSA